MGRKKTRIFDKSIATQRSLDKFYISIDFVIYILLYHMRKVLFWILIIVFLFLVVVLWVAFYNDKTPLRVLKWWFGVEQSVYVKETLSNSSEAEKQVDITEKIKETVQQEQTSATWTVNINPSSKLSEEDIKATQSLVNELIVK